MITSTSVALDFWSDVNDSSCLPHPFYDFLKISRFMTILNENLLFYFGKCFMMGKYNNILFLFSYLIISNQQVNHQIDYELLTVGNMFMMYNKKLLARFFGVTDIFLNPQTKQFCITKTSGFGFISLSTKIIVTLKNVNKYLLLY